MTWTQRLSQIWTAAPPWGALILGAGLSITFNVVDTVDTRGAALDRWDIVTAVAFPALVVLMVELFVSRLWVGQAWPMQAIRWAGTVSIGGIAMRVSWVHGHDFFLSRGQAPDVAGLAPLSIDLLAIMATALILSGRGRTAPATSGQARTAPDNAVADVRTTELDKPAADVRTTGPDKPAGGVRTTGPTMAEVPDMGLDKLVDDVRTAVDTMTATAPDVSDAGLTDWSSLVQQLEAPAAPPPPRTTRGKISDPAEAGRMYAAAMDRMSAGEAERFVAGKYSVSTRTVRRLVTGMGLRPVSGGAPAAEVSEVAQAG